MGTSCCWFCFFMMGCIVGIVRASDTIWRLDRSFNNITITAGRQFQQIDFVRDTMECAVWCFRNSTCSSFFYSYALGQCLLNSDVFATPSTGVRSPGFQYYTSTKDNCPYTDGYVYVRSLNLCFKVYNASVVMMEAYRTCIQHGTQLVSLETMSKATMVSSYLKDLLSGNVVNYYLGATRPGVLDGSRTNWTNNTSAPLYWFRGPPVALNGSDANWITGQPSNTNGIEGCLHIKDISKFNDIRCDYIMSFICEKLL